jgi:3-oxoacyl-[acyl-carrier-protein] synthase III
MHAFLKAISCYFPSNRLTNDQIAARFPEWSAAKIAEKVGVNSRHIAADDEFASDMAVAAAQKLFAEHNVAPAAIDFVLYCTQSPDYFLPSTSCIIQERLGISVKAGALDFNLGCSGYIYGLALAKGLICAGIAKNILLLTAETYSKFIHPHDKSNLTIFGDAAAATLISTDGFARIDEFELGTDGGGAANLIVKNGGMRHPVKDHTSGATDNHLFMDGTEIFNFTSEFIPPLIKDTLAKNNLSQYDVSFFVLHQANAFMLEHLRKKMRIESGKFYNNMSDTGNTVSSTIPIALSQLLKNDTVKAGAYWLLAGFGVGYSWGATVISFK